LRSDICGLYLDLVRGASCTLPAFDLYDPMTRRGRNVCTHCMHQSSSKLAEHPHASRWCLPSHVQVQSFQEYCHQFHSMQVVSILDHVFLHQTYLRRRAIIQRLFATQLLLDIGLEVFRPSLPTKNFSKFHLTRLRPMRPGFSFLSHSKAGSACAPLTCRKTSN
jgi:hypothetical protein